MGKSPRKCIYYVPAQEMAKHPAKFCWPPVSDVGAVKVKFHYASLFEAGQLRTSFEPASNQLRTSFQPDSIIEFGRDLLARASSLLAS